MAIIEIKDLSFGYAGADGMALQNVNLSIDEGEFVLIAGPTGCGKSTLLKCINGLIPNIYSGRYSGSVRVMNLNPATTPPYVMSQYVGMVLQNPEVQLFSLSVEGDVAFALENIGLERSEIVKRIDKVLRILNIEDLRYQSPFELSGGQKQKVAIASVLALQPRILLLDEPTSFLDPMSARSIIELLEMLCKSEKLTVIITEHRLDLLLQHITRLVVMDSGKIVNNDDPRKVLENIPLNDSLIPFPKIVQLARRMKKEYGFPRSIPLTVDEFVKSLIG